MVDDALDPVLRSFEFGLEFPDLLSQSRFGVIGAGFGNAVTGRSDRFASRGRRESITVALDPRPALPGSVTQRPVLPSVFAPLPVALVGWTRSGVIGHGRVWDSITW